MGLVVPGGFNQALFILPSLSFPSTVSVLVLPALHPGGRGGVAGGVGVWQRSSSSVAVSWQWQGANQEQNPENQQLLYLAKEEKKKGD